ncbi:hypothetical protein ATE84_2702 [Aquimarina sp. MAR_2010_214]|uniref:hypothetical protein n=1 Tax=Aquimarina sp. MAR_2010_214 TaxID=1250026 RepID=UPI000C70B469|nr:hypothetical protein [Aquimarina sp. MAR_2010_214]PKV50639.1 hypothetical protein ATE84_2702 [Aquimarina sp. MAR_2010_214]
MKLLKKISLIVLAIIIILFLWATWYKYEYAMEESKTFQVNSPDFEKRLLIATQGSVFKDSITNRIVNQYKSDSIFIKVIDISSLTDVDPQNYTAILLIHTWENWKPPYVIRQFIERTDDQQDKIVVLTTSGGGTYQMPEIDAITGESNLEEISIFVDKIIDRLELKLRLKD